MSISLRTLQRDDRVFEPYELEQMISTFVHHYNFARLHQGVGFITPAERHDGSHTAIVQARRQGMEQARKNRRMIAKEGAGTDR